MTPKLKNTMNTENETTEQKLARLEIIERAEWEEYQLISNALDNVQEISRRGWCNAYLELSAARKEAGL